MEHGRADRSSLLFLFREDTRPLERGRPEEGKKKRDQILASEHSTKNNHTQAMYRFDVPRSLRFDNSVGKVPVNEVDSRTKSFRLVNRPNSVGSWPPYLLYVILSVKRFVNFPIPVGIVPSPLVESTAKNSLRMKKCNGLEIVNIRNIVDVVIHQLTKFRQQSDIFGDFRVELPSSHCE